MRYIASEVVRFAGWPLTVARSNAGEVRLGSAAKPAFVPRSSGVSSIHSAVAWLELYGTVCVNVSFRVTSCSVSGTCSCRSSKPECRAECCEQRDRDAHV
jgi:hypothetical protein